jgi:hypothetical protein
VRSKRTVEHLPGATRTTTVVEGDGFKKIVEHDHLTPGVPIEDFLAPMRMLERDAKSGAASRNAGSVRKISPEILSVVIEKFRAHPNWTNESAFLDFPLRRPDVSDTWLSFDDGKRSSIVYLETPVYKGAPFLDFASRLVQVYLGTAGAAERERHLKFDRFQKYCAEARKTLRIEKKRDSR